MAYKKAFQCKKCPESNSENGCPMWWELMMDNVQSGESKLVKACGYTLMPVVLSHVVAASNRPAAAIESLRNAVLKAPGISCPGDVAGLLGVAHDRSESNGFS